MISRLLSFALLGISDAAARVTGGSALFEDIIRGGAARGQYPQAGSTTESREVVIMKLGQLASQYSDVLPPALAQQLLGWSARLDLARMCQDSWRWQSMNPDGFGPGPI